MSEQSSSPTPSPYRRSRLILAAVVAGLAIGFAGVYGIGAFKRNGNPACQATAALAKTLKPLAHGEVAAVNVPDTPLYVPNLTFHDGAGNTRQLSDWRGRTVLLNLWATWCVPCRKEMPALDALQQKLGGPNFQVVAVNIDTRDPEKPKTWLKEIGVSHLTYYADPSAKVFQDLKAVGRAFGMPTTMLIDTTGCELGTIAGPAEWSSDDALKLIKAATAKL
ncbi:MAG: Thiol:disulfide oxidoreductase TlpA [Pseudolabrys sp.]|jgi:thiol-disulfide isomerase/thioredoxin|nr:Thiol:disulfide oxidoreductase TlpA [Pseudolabrys sp.]